MRLRSLILSALVGVGMMLGGGGKANACHRCNRCTYYYYPTTTYYYCCPQKCYTIWHVYKTDPATGCPQIVSRYTEKVKADNDPEVVAKRAYVVEVMYYAS